MVDLLSTGVTQFAILALSLILVRFIADLVTEEEFGVFMVTRRVVAALIPLTSLNLGVGLARYLSYEPEQRRTHASASLWIVASLSSLAAAVLFVGRGEFSRSFFGSERFPAFAALIGLTVLSANLVGIVSDIYRGRIEMVWSNGLQVLFFVIPLGLLPLAWVWARGDSGSFLALHMLGTGVIGVLLALAFLLLGPAREMKGGPRAAASPEARRLLGYSVSRVPSSFLIGFVFAWPVLVASRSASLELAARIGILATLVRLMETWSYPFNLVLLPRFARIGGDGRADDVRSHASLILDFIATAIPLVGALSFGLGGPVLVLAFGASYVDLSVAAGWILLASSAYVAFVLTRGVLDALHGFPHVNLIAFFGLSCSAAVLIGLKAVTLQTLGGALVAALLGMGGLAVLLLMWTTGARIRPAAFASGLIAGIAAFMIARTCDDALRTFDLGFAGELVAQSTVRVVILAVAYFGFWRRRSLWGRAVWERTWRA
jgi:O-antigen/teichoic acid export membrane protein